MIWIIGGTSEAREVIEKFHNFDDFVVTCATDSEAEFIHKNLVIRRMDYDGMTDFIKQRDIDLVIDLSHPYARIVSSNAKKACDYTSIKYIRYVREKTKPSDGVEYFKSLEDLIYNLKNLKGTVFFTTGSKNIKDFEAVRGDNRFIYRVLPSCASITKCSENGVKMKDIAAVLGPFSTEFNEAMFKEYGAQYVVMKDSGDNGGTFNKIEACRRLNIKAFVVERDEEDGVKSIDEIEKIIKDYRFKKKI